ncbi:hypothetical protein ACW6QP_09175 [Salegentibacter sp. HM20]
MNVTKKTYKTSSLILILGLIVSIGLIYKFYYDLKLAQRELDKSGNNSARVLSRLDSLERKSRADNLFISGSFEEALPIYENLSDGGRYELLENRKEQIRRTESAKLSAEKQFENLRNQKEIQETLWAVRSLMLKRKLENQKDSLRNDYNSRLTNLEKEIQQKETALAKVKDFANLNFQNTNGTPVNYFGEVLAGKANGEGVGVHKTGNIYFGEWKDNTKHGRGVYSWVEGERYEGEFENDKREGEGTYYWPNGDRYVGSWQNDKRNGYGKLYDKDDNIMLEGEWKDNELIQ